MNESYTTLYDQFIEKYNAASTNCHVLNAFTSFLLSTLSLAIPFIALTVIDWITFNTLASSLNILFAGLVTVILFSFLMKVVRTHANLFMARRVAASVAEILNMNMIRPLFVRSAPQDGAKTSHTLRLIETIKSYFATGTISLFWNAICAVLPLTLLALIEPILGLAVALSLPLFIVLGIYMGRSTQRDLQPRVSKAYFTLAFNELAKNTAKRKDLPESGVNQHLSRVWASFFNVEFIRENREQFCVLIAQTLQTVVLLTVFYLGSRFVLAGSPAGLEGIITEQLTIGGLVATLILCYQVLSPFSKLPRAFIDAANLQLCLDELESLYGDEDAGEQLYLERAA